MEVNRSKKPMAVLPAVMRRFHCSVPRCKGACMCVVPDPFTRSITATPRPSISRIQS